MRGPRSNRDSPHRVTWPPERPPIIVSACYAESPADGDARNAVLAEVARIVATGEASRS